MSLALYRKYRPSVFADVIGQEHVTVPLSNALESGKTHHAYLFSGPRGCGKTSSARIMARSLNCEKGPTPNPCGKCQSCNDLVANGPGSIDVIELDAATHGLVDDARDLRDKAFFAPVQSKYKIYIIDEAHQLGPGAANALLKVVEEPPAHAIFILATTEKHKIIPTILSRCQIFDFSRISVKDIAAHLVNIAEKEQVSAEPEALHLIATKADGALRDALSIFDQLVTFSNGNITYQTVLTNLHVLDYDYYFKIVDYLKKEDIAGSILILNDIIEKGFDGHQFIIGLADHFRNLLMAQDVRTLPLLELTDQIKDRFKEQASAWEKIQLTRALYTLSKADVAYKSSKNQRLLVEVTLMELGSLQQEAEKKN